MCENMGSSNSATSVYLMSDIVSGELVLLVYSHGYGYQASNTYEYSYPTCAHSWTAQIPLK